MTDEQNAQISAKNGAEHPQHAPNVSITIDDKEYTVHRGRYTVASLKALAGVAQNYELDEIVNGQIVPLANDASVTIKGDEVFVSNVKIGQSS